MPAASAGITIVGAGALGQSFAALLAVAGVPVTLFARASTAEQLLAQGCIRTGGVLNLEAPLARIAGAWLKSGTVGLATSPADIPPGSGVMFATKAHQLSHAVSELRNVPCAWVLGVQNGMQKDDILAAAFGMHRLVGAATILSAQRGPAGSILVSGAGPTYVGELEPSARSCAEDALRVLAGAGVQVEREPDVRRVLWSKACNAAGVFGVCVLGRCSFRAASASAPLVRAFLSLVRETAALALAYGVEVADYPGFPIRTYITRPEDITIATLAEQVRPSIASGAPEGFPSMVQDLLAGRPMEVEGVFGDLVERSRRIGVEVPRVALVCELLRGIDSASAS